MASIRFCWSPAFVGPRCHDVRIRGSYETARIQGKTGKPGSALRVTRQGKDVRGLYPGQLGRVHVISSQDRRLKFASLQHSQRPDDDQYNEYARSFDLQTFRALDVLHQSISACQRASETTYQGEFGAQSLLFCH